VRNSIELVEDMDKAKRRGLGRQKLQQLSAQELRVKAVAGIKRTANY
jgi:hypothetical protein